jgi:hypothetical protein
MKSRLVKLIGIILAVALAGVQPQSTYANVNIHGSSCQPGTGWGLSDIGINEPGFYYSRTGPQNTYIEVVCNLPHSPPPTAATSPLAIYVDGDDNNATGQPVFCGLFSRDWTGTFLGSVETSRSSQSFELYLSLPAAQVPYWAYTSVVCYLPPGGTLRGITLLGQSLAQ